MNENGQAPNWTRVNPEAVAFQLSKRIEALSMELAMKDAYIAYLEAGGETKPAEAPLEEVT